MGIELPGPVVDLLRAVREIEPIVKRGAACESASDLAGKQVAASFSVGQVRTLPSDSCVELAVESRTHTSAGRANKSREGSVPLPINSDTAADAIVGVRTKATGELAVTAALCMDDPVAVIAASSLAESATMAVTATTSKVVRCLVWQLVQHFKVRVIVRKVKLLEALVERASGGLTCSTVGASPGVPHGAGYGRSFMTIAANLQCSTADARACAAASANMSNGSPLRLGR